MNRRILMSITSIVASAALVAGATFAFFSDSETSSGNTFTAGKIDLQIGNHAWYNGEVQNDSSWGLSNLSNQLFFNYADLKPGDWEEDTIDLRVDDNPSWVCANLKMTQDDDMDCTGPELEDDNDCSESNESKWDGELGRELSFIFWADDGDNVLEDNEEVVLSGAPGDLPRGDNNVGKTFPIVDSQTNLFGDIGEALPGGETVHIGKAFCFGTITEEPVAAGDNNSPVDNPGFVCDGSLVTDAAQTDSIMGDMSFSAVQSRHNDGFVCGEKTVVGLDNKDTDWNRISDDTYGNLSFKSANPTFDYDLSVHGLQAGTNYSLIYYPDPWPGTGGIEIGTLTTDGNGNATVSGDVDLGTDLPIGTDQNGAGAKLWVVLSSDWNGTQMTGWQPAEYLFEENLVAYDDTDA